MSDPATDVRKARLATLEAQMEALEENGQRLRDSQKLAFGALIGVAALLIAFAWYGGRKNYQDDLSRIAADLDKKNEDHLRQIALDLKKTEQEREKLLDQKIAVRWQELQLKMASLNVGSSTNIAQISADLTRKIALMGELIESRHGEAFGLTYFNQAIATLNRGLFAPSTEYFLSAALAFWKANDEANVQTCIARLNQYCFPRLRPRDISTRPAIDEKYALLLRELERANTGGKWQVAIQDLRKAMAEARTRK